ncbi:MAG TPA: hypothetical protein VEC06_05695 [Paucimonas sp.]|nr:hypothetical protein [Paucimonas sp.]
MAATLSRRSFLKVGLFGALALAATGGIYRLARGPVSPAPYILDDEARTALRAIASALLHGALPASAQAVDTHLARVQTAIAGLPLNTQKEIQDLFGLLVLGPTRRFLVGLPEDWAHARQEDVVAFLQSWRTHRLGLLQSAYHALHDLAIGPWYADESNWAAIGYPGPIKELS